MKFLLFLSLLLISTVSHADWPGWESGNPIKPAAITYPGSVQTTNQTLTASQTGQTIVFNNSTGVAANATKFTLPTATVGLEFTFIADVAKSMQLAPQATDTINFASLTAGQKIANSGSAAIGDSITVICRTANQWSIKNKVGTWAFQN